MKQFNAVMDGVLRAGAWFAAAVFAAIALLITVNVILRNGFGTTVYGLLDAVEYGLLAATFLAAPWVLSKNAHVSIDLVTGALPERVARPLARCVAALGAVICAVFLYYALQAAIISAGRGSMIRTAFTIPEWWVLSVAPVSFALLSLEFLRQMISPPADERRATGL